jgi:hypothetical protein
MQLWSGQGATNAGSLLPAAGIQRKGDKATTEGGCEKVPVDTNLDGMVDWYSENERVDLRVR